MSSVDAFTCFVVINIFSCTCIRIVFLRFAIAIVDRVAVMVVILTVHNRFVNVLFDIVMVVVRVGPSNLIRRGMEVSALGDDIVLFRRRHCKALKLVVCFILVVVGIVLLTVGKL